MSPHKFAFRFSHALPLLFAAALAFAADEPASNSGALLLAVNKQDGSYTIGARGLADPVLHAAAAIEVNGHWLRASDYPVHAVTKEDVAGELGGAQQWTIRYTGRKDAPELLVKLRAYASSPFGEVQVTAHSTLQTPVTVQALRVLQTERRSESALLNLGGPAEADRVLSDSFSEDRPAIQIRDLADSEKGTHRGVGSQLVYNRQSGESWFIGALTSDRFLSVLRLHMADGAQMASYDVESTGTTELLEENSLQDSPAEDRVQLSLPLAPGAELSSERMLFSVSSDYHQQLETYGRLVRELHNARVSAPTPLGWWSWTAYYFGLNQGTALTNAQWLSQHLKPLGYTYFHMDEGYQFARGEYATPDAALFPHGVGALEHKVMEAGLTPGIWTAPFEVSERSWIFAHHPEWLVHNAQGRPVHLGLVTDGKDHLYALDTTHPDAQAYLRSTYSTLVNEWGIRYIKMDFMEDSAVEGFYHQPHTTALEAQRIGLQTIRDAVGDGVLLDKDGSELLNPVGIVDMGRISQDTGHTFSSSKDTAPGMAARYYMNRNYFLSDPDAFTVSMQTVDDQSWHGGSKPLTLDEAKVSIALSAISGGLFEIGDDLPTLGESPDRLALVENPDLRDMAHLGRASVPLDLMSYTPADLQPSIFLLHEDARQSMLTVFNWTEKPQVHTFTRAELGLQPQTGYTFAEILTPNESAHSLGADFKIEQPAHSVRMLKILNTEQHPAPPSVTATVPPRGKAGETLAFAAHSEAEPVLRVLWNFGDGVSTESLSGGTFSTEHAYTHPGEYKVQVRSVGLNGASLDQSFPVTITGTVVTNYLPQQKRRFPAERP